MSSVLNIGGGKIRPFDFKESHVRLYSDIKFLVNLDKMYFNPTIVEQIISEHEEYNNEHEILEGDEVDCYREHSCNIDMYEFLERYHLTFDVITMYRILEHIPKTKVLYFIYLLSTAVEIGGYIDIIVPDYELLAKRILNENTTLPNFEAEDIITTFELLNEPYCPHASLWTVNRLLHFFNLEGRFIFDDIKPNYNFDGRNIYIRALARRVK